MAEPGTHLRCLTAIGLGTPYRQGVHCASSITVFQQPQSHCLAGSALSRPRQARPGQGCDIRHARRIVSTDIGRTAKEGRRVRESNDEHRMAPCTEVPSCSAVAAQHAQHFHEGRKRHKISPHRTTRTKTWVMLISSYWQPPFFVFLVDMSQTRSNEERRARRGKNNIVNCQKQSETSVHQAESEGPGRR